MTDLLLPQEPQVDDRSRLPSAEDGLGLFRGLLVALPISLGLWALVLGAVALAL